MHRINLPRIGSNAGIAQLVEHNLAKVGVASSNLVSRSILPISTGSENRLKKAFGGFCLDLTTAITRASLRELRSESTTPRIGQLNAGMIRRRLAEWQSGYAAACKAVYLGSIPGSASICDTTVPCPDGGIGT